MWSSTGKLLVLRLRLLWNTFKHRSIWQKIGTVFGYAIVVVFGVFFGYATWWFVRFVNTPGFQAEFQSAGLGIEFDAFLDRIPLLLLSGAFLIGLLANLSVLLQTLYLAGDMEFLLSAPIPVRSVFLSKLLQSALPVIVLLGLLSGPAMIGMGAGRGFAWPYYIAFPIFLAMLVLDGAGLAALAVMLLVRVVPSRRAAEAIALVGGVATFLCSYSGQLMAVDDAGWLTRDRIAGFASLGEALGESWNPIGWAGRALAAWAEPAWLPASSLSAASLLVGVGIFALTLVGAERLYLSGWSRLTREAPGARIRRRNRRIHEQERASAGAVAAVSTWIPAPVRALVLKDFRLFRRDLRNLSQLILPIIMAVIWGISFGSPNSDAPEAAGRIMGSVGLLMGVMMAWGFAMRLGLGAFSLEGQQWWIIRTSPVRRDHLLIAKYIVTVVPSIVVGACFIVLLSVFSRRAVGSAAFDLLILSIVLAGMSGLMLAFGIWTAKFDWKDPRVVQAGTTGGCLVTIVSMVTIIFILGVFQGLPPVLTYFADISEFWANALGLGLGTLISLTIGTFPLVFASGRMDRLGEDRD